jgi:hypothetical protein
MNSEEIPAGVDYMATQETQGAHVEQNRPDTEVGTPMSALARDRLSSEELLRRGLAVRYPVTASPPTFEPPLRPEIPGLVYVLQAPPLMAVKIGFTRKSRREMHWRVKGIQTGCPYPLKVLARVKALPSQEREAHKLLAADRLTGEWFDWTPRVQAFVAALSKGMAAGLTTTPEPL